MNSNLGKGILLTLLSALLWAISGMSAQFLQQERGITSEWLVVVRLLSAGVITTGIAYARQGKEMFRFLKNKYDILRVAILGIMGIGACQYTYFKAIYLSDAGTATMIQYTAPAMIIVYLFFRYYQVPTIGEVASVILAMAGTFMIATQGTLEMVNLTPETLVWSIFAAITLAIYTVQPIVLLVRYGPVPILGPAMICGGLFVNFFFPFPGVIGIWDMWTWLGMFGIVICGTVFSFISYLEGVRLVGAVTASIVTSVEPVLAAFLAWGFLGTEFTIPSIIGFAMILMTILIISYEKKRRVEG